MNTRNFLERNFNAIWYEKSSAWIFLWPLSLIFRILVAVRRAFYAMGVLRSYHSKVPVVVVGNITVGGVGKTPMVMRLAELFMEIGLKPGILTRGYGGSRVSSSPLLLDENSRAEEFGDEALLMFRRLGIPVAICSKRARSAKLLEEHEVDVIISDDGLQHYGLSRDIEIAIIDGERQLGNRQLLPAGPLRESAKRLKRVDFVIYHRASCGTRENCMFLQEANVIKIGSGEQKTLALLGSEPLHAVAGIGNPKRFFNALQQAGLRIVEHAFPDHHLFTKNDFEFAGDETILMTEKDAVKCQELGLENAWYLRVNSVLSDDIESRLVQQINAILAKSVII